MQKLSYKARNKFYCFDSNGLNIIKATRLIRQPLISLGIIIDTAFRIPPYTGVTYRLFYLSKKLVELGIQVKIFFCNRNIKNDSDAETLINNSGLELHIIPEKIFYDIKKLNEIIAANKVSILQVEDPASALRYYSIAVNLKIPVVIEMHDIEPTLQKYFGKSQEKIDLSYAISYFSCQLSDIVICMTPSDSTKLFEKIGINPSKIKIIPNPIDFSEFQFYGPNIRRPNIIFIGNMFYGPNYKAVEYVITKIYPMLSQRYKDIIFTFIGLVPDELKKRVNNSKIIFTGPVDNINSVLREATIALCPIIQGSGMKVKILNYCASGLPVITTSLGASGYEKIYSLMSPLGNGRKSPAF